MNVIFKQLPDIHYEREYTKLGLNAYGRFGVLADSSLWIGNHLSTHPSHLIMGFYWAVDMYGNLILSPRNLKSEIEVLQGEDNVIVRGFFYEMMRMGFCYSQYIT